MKRALRDFILYRFKAKQCIAFYIIGNDNRWKKHYEIPEKDAGSNWFRYNNAVYTINSQNETRSTKKNIPTYFYLEDNPASVSLETLRGNKELSSIANYRSAHIVKKSIDDNRLKKIYEIAAKNEKLEKGLMLGGMLVIGAVVVVYMMLSSQIDELKTILQPEKIQAVSSFLGVIK